MKGIWVFLSGLVWVSFASAQNPGHRWLRKPLPLDEKVQETSGLFATSEGIWTFNDSGGEPEIYLIDTLTGAVVKTLRIHQALNKDWEATTIGSGNLYIGDFGNNSGKRTDLKVYQCPLPAPEDSILRPKAEIRFRWPDVLYCLPEEKLHDRDCEAIVSMLDTLYVFSKSWKTLSVKMASLVGAQPQIATLADSLFTGFVVTDAAFQRESPGKGTLVLLGYENKIPGDVWLWILQGTPGSAIFKGSTRSLKLGNALQLGQTEGICFIGDNQVLISAEKFGLNSRALLHFLDLSE